MRWASCFWWAGFVVYFQTPGCIVAITLLACCARTRTPLLGIFGKGFARGPLSQLQRRRWWRPANARSP